MPRKVEIMSVVFASPPVWLQWNCLPQQQHGAQQPQFPRADADAVALLKKRQTLAMTQSKARMR